MRRKFAKEFKQKAVKLTEEMKLKHLARDLGINPNFLPKCFFYKLRTLFTAL